MAKRKGALSGANRPKGPHKTKKRLAIKAAMLAAKKAKKTK
jgi:hypothetical protein